MQLRPWARSGSGEFRGSGFQQVVACLCESLGNLLEWLSRTLPRSTPQNALFPRLVRFVKLRLALRRLAPEEAGLGRFLVERHRQEFFLRSKP